MNSSTLTETSSEAEQVGLSFRLASNRKRFGQLWMRHRCGAATLGRMQQTGCALFSNYFSTSCFRNWLNPSGVETRFALM